MTGVVAPIVGLIGIVIIGFVVAIARSTPPPEVPPDHQWETGKRATSREVAAHTVARRSVTDRRSRRPSRMVSPDVRQIRTPSVPAAESWDEALSRWTKEARDPAWTENMKSYLASVSFSVDAGPELVADVDCRQTTCRITAQLGQLQSVDRGTRLLVSDGFTFFSKMTEPFDGTAVAFVTADPARANAP
jgi:hypothetical protein